ncbi:hypothetical protein NC651_025972 [Populus alba x Populus x berolinensis]|nr:hypothetical protein NC651_025972 [Populus alba x Populus x berolinensis]
MLRTQSLYQPCISLEIPPVDAGNNNNLSTTPGQCLVRMALTSIPYCNRTFH